MADVYSDDEDGPVIFKRSCVSKQNQLNPEITKSSSQRYNASSVQSSNGQNSSIQKDKTISCPKETPLKIPSASPKASISSGKISPMMSNSKATASPSNQLKHASKSSAVKDEDHLVKRPIVPNYNEEDSEDDKPLSYKIKLNSNQAHKGLTVPTTGPSLSPKSKISVKASSEDSDDGKPLISKYQLSVKAFSEDSDDEKTFISKYQLKSNVGTSGHKLSADDGKKPLLSKPQQNGSNMRVSQEKLSTMPSKRPIDKVNSLNQSSVKKSKLVNSSKPMKVEKLSVKAETKANDDDDDDDIPLSQRCKKSTTPSEKKLSIAKKKTTKVVTPTFKRTTKKSKKVMKNSKYSKSMRVPPGSGDGQRKWTTLIHNGVIFPPPYQPHRVKMLYKGKPVDLTPEQEEVATMYAVMQDTEYMNKEKFKENFWNDWRKLLGKNHTIQKLEDCNFTPIYDWYQKEKEKKKQMSGEEKKALREEKLKQEEKYMWAIVDGVKEKVGNFRVEPPGLFRGRGEHPKMGKLKTRIHPSDITINIGKDSPIPECPIAGESWKEIRHDNTVTWLAYWNDPINQKEFKYVFLAASSSLKGQSDKEKYEKARLLKDYIKNIRAAYTKDFGNKDIMKRQIAVATYLIDKLALRAGNEKDDDEADTVGCCTLKVENVKPEQPNKLEFSFLGKDSIKYHNVVEVELPVYKAIIQFQAGKKDGDDLFDKLDTSKLNAHLKELMPGLTAKVFRTYNASITLDEMLSRDMNDGEVAEKVVVYQHANKEVAIICNHQRTESKSHAAQMTKLTDKINDLKADMKELKTDLDRAKKKKPPLKDASGKQKRNLTPEALESKIAQTNFKIEKMERDMRTKEDLKTVALGTSKINYLDPRITVAWCKRHDVPIEKIFNKSLLAKFAWAMDVEPKFRF